MSDVFSCPLNVENRNQNWLGNCLKKWLPEQTCTEGLTAKLRRGKNRVLPKRRRENDHCQEPAKLKIASGNKAKRQNVEMTTQRFF